MLLSFTSRSAARLAARNQRIFARLASATPAPAPEPALAAAATAATTAAIKETANLASGRGSGSGGSSGSGGKNGGGRKWARRAKWAVYTSAAVGSLGALLVYKTHPMPQQDPDPNKKTVVVLGTGWGAVSFLRRLDTSEYNTIVVSPRNFFLFTPLLPSVTTGSLESRSVITPIKFFTRFKPFGITFVEAEATDIDPASKTVEITDNGEIKGAVVKTRVPYDYLVISVGAESQTFNIPGVREFGMFLKEIWDARKIRTRIMDCIETAAFPGQPDDEVRRLLHFVVVGGGPTGVEYAGELYDFMQEEIQKWYPDIAGKMKISLIEALPHVLPMFSRDMIEYTEGSFKDMNIDILSNTAVKEVGEKVLTVQDKDGNRSRVPYGMLVWATGNTTRPLVQALMKKLAKDQTNRRGLAVDDYLRVLGAQDMWAIGDCTATKFAPTAQVAAQQGTYLARQLNDIALSARTGRDIVATCPPFHYKHRATLAYIGDERGVSDVHLPFLGEKAVTSFAGYQSYLFWRSAYMSNLFTLRNKLLVAFDWTKEKLFGRDISRE